jgi:hypothetical protein
MKKFIEQFSLPQYQIILLVVFLTGCGASQTNYQREYAKVWKEHIKSQAWKESLIASNSDASTELYVSNDNIVTLAEEESIVLGFEDKYQSLVSKAYFKIITEAEKADITVTAEYQKMQNEQSTLREDKKRTLEITKRYQAHKAMLSGLKSWNIFSENRSGDLEYFKAENEAEIQKMLQSGENDNQIVNYLIYKLADLYHVEGN